MARKPQPLSKCCEAPLEIDDDAFHPWLKTDAEVKEAGAAGKPVYCSGCGEVAAMREP